MGAGTESGSGLMRTGLWEVRSGYRTGCDAWLDRQAYSRKLLAAVKSKKVGLNVSVRYGKATDSNSKLGAPADDSPSRGHRTCVPPPQGQRHNGTASDRGRGPTARERRAGLGQRVPVEAFAGDGA